MKRLLICLIALFLLSGCSKKPLGTLKEVETTPTLYFLDDPSDLDLVNIEDEEVTVAYTLDRENSEVVITLTKGDRSEELRQVANIEYDYVTLSINPTIKLYFDEYENIVAYDYLNQDAEDAYKDIELIGAPLKETLTTLIDVAQEKEYLNEENTTVEILAETPNTELKEELETLVNTYVENAEFDVSVTLSEQDENGQAVVLAVNDNIDKFEPGIYVMDKWIGESDGWCVNAGVCGKRIIVFGENHTGYLVHYSGRYDNDIIPVVSLAFDWTDDGVISYRTPHHWVVENHGGRSDGSNFSYENGILTETLTSTEYVTYHHVDTCEPVYVKGFNGVPFVNEHYYEPNLKDFETDFNGILNYNIWLYVTYANSVGQ